MSVLSRLRSIVSSVIQESDTSPMFRIVDFCPTKGKFYFQRISTKVVITFSHSDIQEYPKIISTLSASQACFLGIEHAKQDSSDSFGPSSGYTLQKRPGGNSLQYIDRSGNVSYFDKTLGDSSLVDPRVLALTPEVLEDFHSSEAFYIGFLAGRKFFKESPVSALSTDKKPSLRVV